MYMVFLFFYQLNFQQFRAILSGYYIIIIIKIVMLARDSRFNHLSSEKENDVLILFLNLQTILTTDVASLNLKWHYTATKWFTQQLHELRN